MSLFELVSLKGGGHSLRSLKNKEIFHPTIGPAAEAQILHIASQRLRGRAQTLPEVNVWDVGLGAGANAIAVIDELRNIQGKKSELHSFDLTTAPLEFAISHSSQLSYLEGYGEILRQLLSDGFYRISPFVTWYLHVGDFRERMKSPGIPSPSAILYDPYSPLHNPELWTLEHFQRLFEVMDPAVPMLMTSYTRSTAMRVALILAGFFVGRGCAVGEKIETTLVTNSLELLSDPLDETWLQRVRVSGNGAPLREGATYSQSSISAVQFEMLCQCPQFTQKK